MIPELSHGCLFLHFQPTRCWSLVIVWVISGMSHSTGPLEYPKPRCRLPAWSSCVTGCGKPQILSRPHSAEDLAPHPPYWSLVLIFVLLNKRPAKNIWLGCGVCSYSQQVQGDIQWQQEMKGRTQHHFPKHHQKDALQIKKALENTSLFPYEVWLFPRTVCTYRASLSVQAKANLFSGISAGLMTSFGHLSLERRHVLG